MGCTRACIHWTSFGGFGARSPESSKRRARWLPRSTSALPDNLPVHRHGCIPLGLEDHRGARQHSNRKGSPSPGLARPNFDPGLRFEPPTRDAPVRPSFPSATHQSRPPCVTAKQKSHALYRRACCRASAAPVAFVARAARRGLYSRPRPRPPRERGRRIHPQVSCANPGCPLEPSRQWSPACTNSS